ncbi:MAG: radical SAM protein [Quinella sp. 3Q1]|nr:radical SAM protein [Quinella sp. 3Q1]
MKIVRTGAEASFDEMPIQVSWFLTAKCNYRCSYCFHYGEGKRTPPQLPFSTLPQIETAIKNIASLNRPWYDLSLIGGEPIVHPHVTDVISMFHESLGERLNCVIVSTNGSRNESFYEKIADIGKYVYFRLNISIHTDHVDMAHILNLIERLARHVHIKFALMFNPAKREMVYEIYETLCEYRKKFYFQMDIPLIHAGDRIDPRHTQEDFDWQKKAIKQFNDIVKKSTLKSPAVKYKYTLLFRDMEVNDKIKHVRIGGSRAQEIAEGLKRFKGMYCTSCVSVLRIHEDGRFKGMVCSDDPYIGNIFEENALLPLRDKLIHPVKCSYNICACPVNDGIPKFASEEDAKKFVEFARNRQMELFAEYDAAHPFQKI